ncbi:hypothetical protein [Paraburkholderia sp. BL6669N2]|uniref:hypothetical protein n=1 Tax=Paraburkholderia sp. BL6669N2 TaxID=1938807 RepID=UPI000E23220E|nr:hypothetical protein [Paraburkholderia sp. BL6669N2]
MMSDDQKVGQALGDATRQCWLLRRALKAKISEAERLIAQAFEGGIEIDPADIAVVRRARHAIWHFTGSEALEIALDRTLMRLVKQVRYPNAQVAEDLRRADELASYAAFSGHNLTPADIAVFSRARAAQKQGTWDADVESAFYPAVDRLASSTLPVVAETAGGEARRGARRAIRIYTWSAVVLTFAVVSLSCLLFTVNQVSDDVLHTVQLNDAGSMALHNQLVSYGENIVVSKQKTDRELRALLGSAYQETFESGNATPEVIDAREKASNELYALSNSQPALQIKENLQQFATNNRQLFNDVHRIRLIGRVLNLSVTNRYTDRDPDCPETAPKAVLVPVNAASSPVASDWICDQKRIRDSLEIKVPMLQPVVNEGKDKDKDDDFSLHPEGVIKDGFVKIAAYQDIRAMALYGREIILSFVGALTGFVLPVVYAWLGACAAILRKIKIECETSRFHPEYSKVGNRSHVTCAIIVGIAIGLFSDLVQGGKNISPLGVAFVAGYASDKFFYFVDRLVDVIFPSRQAGSGPVATDERSTTATVTYSGLPVSGAAFAEQVEKPKFT